MKINFMTIQECTLACVLLTGIVIGDNITDKAETAVKLSVLSEITAPLSLQDSIESVTKSLQTHFELNLDQAKTLVEILQFMDNHLFNFFNTQDCKRPIKELVLDIHPHVSKLYTLAHDAHVSKKSRKMLIELHDITLKIITALNRKQNGFIPHIALGKEIDPLIKQFKKLIPLHTTTEIRLASAYGISLEHLTQSFYLKRLEERLAIVTTA